MAFTEKEKPAAHSEKCLVSVNHGMSSLKDVADGRNYCPMRTLRDAGFTAKDEIEKVRKGALDRIHGEMNESLARFQDTDAEEVRGLGGSLQP